MTSKPSQPDPDHRRLAVDLFNATWDYLDNTDRSPADDLEMLGAALGSWFHWRRAGTPRNFAISDWQVSRVFAVLGDGAMARRFGQSNLDLCDEHDLDPFVRAYAYEALARAAAISGVGDDRNRYAALAEQTAADIEKSGDRQAVLDDLATLPG